jgi:hypothetical protein
VGAVPTLGFVERFPGTSTQGWASLQMTFSNLGTGGVGGEGDGYLRMSRSTLGHFGAVARGPEYVGDWRAAGITQLRLWLNDVESDEAFEVHVSVGYNDNLWQYDVGFIPPENAWAEFVVDLSSASGFSHIRDPFGRDFEEALQNGSLIHVRHDRPPFMQIPDSIAGLLGVDHVVLTDGLIGVGGGGIREPVTLGAPAPNPSRGPVALTIGAATPQEIELTIVDPAGRVIRRARSAAGPVPRVWTWDGRDGAGRAVPAGAYRIRAVGPNGGVSRSLVRIR